MKTFVSILLLLCASVPSLVAQEFDSLMDECKRQSVENPFKTNPRDMSPDQLRKVYDESISKMYTMGDNGLPRLTLQPFYTTAGIVTSPFVTDGISSVDLVVLAHEKDSLFIVRDTAINSVDGTHKELSNTYIILMDSPNHAVGDIIPGNQYYIARDAYYVDSQWKDPKNQGRPNNRLPVLVSAKAVESHHPNPPTFEQFIEFLGKGAAFLFIDTYRGNMKCPTCNGTKFVAGETKKPGEIPKRLCQDCHGTGVRSVEAPKVLCALGIRFPRKSRQ